MSDRNPMIGLLAAGLALVMLPAGVQLYRSVTPRLALGPDELVAAAAEVDAFWADNFKTQFPDAWGGYRTPKLSFDDVATDTRAAGDDYAGYYVNDAQSIHVDLDRNRAHGYLLLVLAHEYGHHVQNLSGQRRSRDIADLWAGGAEGKRIGVRYELQAECLAGVWAHFAAPDGALISRRDVDSWRNRSLLGGDSETHGTAKQRLKWFNVGYESGQARACDTFAPGWESL